MPLAEYGRSLEEHCACMVAFIKRPACALEVHCTYCTYIQAKAKVDEFIHNQGAENQVAPILKGIPEDLIRPDRQQLMDVMLEKRL
eukprot:scaffold283812_cov17-Tisochrysis_lutea.AAC.1